VPVVTTRKTPNESISENYNKLFKLVKNFLPTHFFFKNLKYCLKKGTYKFITEIWKFYIEAADGQVWITCDKKIVNHYVSKQVAP
jgi:hypothetical protein